MRINGLIWLFWIAEPFACLLALGLLFRAGQVSRYRSFATYLSFHVVSTLWLMALYRFHQAFIPNPHTAYRWYFYSYWVGYAAESAILFFVLLDLFNLAMEPLQGLRSIGRLVFRWAAVASIFVAVGSVVAPHTSQVHLIATFCSLFQRGESILVLVLLAFLIIAARPLKLQPTNRIFGICLGFGLMAMVDLLQSSWLMQLSGSLLSSSFNLIKGFADVASMIVWVVYFAFPEPKPKLITLPIRSPLLLWNDVAEALGTPIPHIALNASPDMFTPGELEVMRLSMEDGPHVGQTH